MKKRYARILAATLSAAMVFTSAPTAAFATEISVSEDAVEAEGYNATDIDALFPAKVKIQYGTSTVELLTADDEEFGDVAVAGSGITTDLVNGDGNITRTVKTDLTAAELAKASVGTDVVVTISYELVSDEAQSRFEGNAAYDSTIGTNGGIKKVYNVKTSKATVDPSTYETFPTDVSVEFGGATGTCTGGWTFVEGSASAEVKAADVSVSTYYLNGAKFQLDTNKYPAANYDTEALLKALNSNDAKAANVVYTLEKDIVTVSVPVQSITAKAITADKITWPTTLPKLTVGDALNDVKIDACDVADFKVTKVVVGTTTYNAGQTIAKAGSAVVTVTSKIKTNYTLVDQTKEYIVDIAKKVIKISDVNVTLIKSELPYGTSYAEAAQASNVQTSDGTYSTASFYASQMSTDAAKGLMPVGTTNIKFSVDSGNPDIVYSNTGLQTSVVDVPVKITAPVFTITPIPSASLTIDGSGKVDVTEMTAAIAIKDSSVGSVYKAGANTYQWYSLDANKKATAIDGATAYTYDPAAMDANKLPAGGYICKIKPGFDNTIDTGVKNTTTDAAKEAYEAAVGVLETKPAVFKATATNMTGSTGIADVDNSINYGDTTTFTAMFANAPGYEMTAIAAKAVDENGKVTNLEFTKTFDGPSNKWTVVAAVPATLMPGNYEVSVSYTSAKAGTTDVATYADVLEVTKKELSDTDIKSGAKANASAGTIVYGTKTSDIKITSTVPYGTFVPDASNDKYLAAGTADVSVKFVPSADTLTKYDVRNLTGVYNCPITVTRKEITVKANDIELVVGQELPKADTLTFTPSGAVAEDDFAEMKYAVKVSYGTPLEEALLKDSIKKEGTYKGSVKTVFNDGTTDYNTATPNATTTGVNIGTNYVVKIADADVIVKPVEEEKPSTPPTVAPTPAPVKQAVAATPKASKAKVTVKAGKKYTLKVKLKAGTKATVKKIKWTSSKKSVATVSSKGKVTAKKAGKAAIYARVYFKDGSMKKIKFTVTVK